MIHQFDEFQAEKITADKIISNPKVSVLWSHEARSFQKRGDKMLAEIEDLKTGKRIELTRDGIFIFVGLKPNTAFLKDTSIKLNDRGYIIANTDMQTNIAGVYAAGDVRDKKHRQITTAVSDGSVAALEIIHNF